MVSKNFNTIKTPTADKNYKKAQISTTPRKKCKTCVFIIFECLEYIQKKSKIAIKKRNLIIHKIWSWYRGNKIPKENQCRIIFSSKWSNKNWGSPCSIFPLNRFYTSVSYFIWFHLHLRGELILEPLAHFIPV